MVEKEYKILEYKNGKKDIAVVFKNVKYPEVLGSFFNSDIIPFEEWVKADFDKVLSGEIAYEEVSGNVCLAEIRMDTTKVYDKLIEDDDTYYSHYCEVDTQELRCLIDEWCDKVREFKESIR